MEHAQEFGLSAEVTYSLWHFDTIIFEWIIINCCVDLFCEKWIRIEKKINPLQIFSRELEIFHVIWRKKDKHQIQKHWKLLTLSHKNVRTYGVILGIRKYLFTSGYRILMHDIPSMLYHRNGNASQSKEIQWNSKVDAIQNMVIQWHRLLKMMEFI